MPILSIIIVLQQDLRRSIPALTEKLGREKWLLIRNLLSITKINNLDTLNALAFLHHQFGWFQPTMDDILGMQIIDTLQNIGDHFPCKLLSNNSMLNDFIHELLTLHDIQDHEDSFVILPELVYCCDVWVVQLRQN